MGNRREKSPLSWIIPIVFLLITNPGLLVLAIPLAVFSGIIWLVILGMKQNQGSSPKSAAPTRYTTRQEKFDECPQSLFCRHKDKAVHHVRRGKEIDPWDRPDIDISKYQRNR